jgi:LEA14-like dessication related protein
MIKYKPILILAGAGVIGYSLYRYYMKQITFLKDITYQVVGLKIRSFTPSSVSMDLTTRIYNASNVEATVKEMYLDFFINGIKVGNVNEVKDILILPSRTTDVSFNFAFNPRLIGKNILDLISLSIQAKDLVFDVKGYIKVKSSFLTPTIPFEYQNNLKNILNTK